MLTRLLLAVVFALSLLTPASIAPPTASAADCQFVIGFKTIHDLIPDVVGDCKTNEYHNAQNGDGLQDTIAWHGKGGLLVWRKSDNWTAFTDGQSAWLNGPFGIEKRDNGQRFMWELDATDHTPIPVTAHQAAVCDSSVGRASGQPGASCFAIYANQKILGLTNAAPAPIRVSPVQVPVPQVAPAPVFGSTIESRIRGEFHGWDGETVFVLDNGQIWRQSSYAYYYYYAYSPNVLIYPKNGAWYMQVEGVPSTIQVEPLR